MICPYENETCLGTKCGNFNDPDGKFGKQDMPRGCMGDNPTAQWSRWYSDKFGSKEVERSDALK